MNWINNVVRPKLQGIWPSKRDMPDNLWIKCPETGQMVFMDDLKKNQFVVPTSDYHMRMTAEQRLHALFDDSEYETLETPIVPLDPLKFKDERKYTDRLKDARSKTDMIDAMMVGVGKLYQQTVVMAVQDFRFMGGSLGMAAGKMFVEGAMKAIELNCPYIMFAASGGARMQEGILSLMQLPRTTVAVQRLRDAGLPYIVVLTHPTTGGVTASYAMLGDVQIAEPGALICFAGPRVIEQTIREKLPEGFQRAEYLLEHGMIDMVVHRHELRNVLGNMCHILMHKQLPVFETEEIEDEIAADTVPDDQQAELPFDKDVGTSEKTLQAEQSKPQGRNGAQPPPNPDWNGTAEKATRDREQTARSNGSLPDTKKSASKNGTEQPQKEAASTANKTVQSTPSDPADKPEKTADGPEQHSK